MEPERSRFTFVSNAPLRVDQVNTVGPAGVRALGGIAEIVEDRRKLYAKLPHTRPGDVAALFFILWAREKNLVLKIVLALPDVGGMRFLYVHHEKRHAVAVVGVELVERRNRSEEHTSELQSH